MLPEQIEAAGGLEDDLAGSGEEREQRTGGRRWSAGRTAAAVGRTDGGGGRPDGRQRWSAGRMAAVVGRTDGNDHGSNRWVGEQRQQRDSGGSGRTATRRQDSGAAPEKIAGNRRVAALEKKT